MRDACQKRPPAPPAGGKARLRGPTLAQEPEQDIMRSFIIACLVAALIAAGAAYVLDSYVQESVSTTFSTQGTRI
jgi:hypothetical protein